MAAKFDKEVLFEDYFSTLQTAFSEMEFIFAIKGLWSQVLGIENSGKTTFSSPEEERAAKDHVRKSYAWIELSNLFDYAVYGISGSADPRDIVIGGAEVLSFITSENQGPAAEWNLITAQGDGRFALDDGEFIEISKLALLAGVDIRTVRNAISAGELVSTKNMDTLCVENASARLWLRGRRGFTPTVWEGKGPCDLKAVVNPAQFGALLIEQRKAIGLDSTDKKIVAFHPSVDSKAISEIEAGIFRLPLDTVFPIADFYQLDRKELLSCVMRVFFSEQLTVLSEVIAKR